MWCMWSSGGDKGRRDREELPAWGSPGGGVRDLEPNRGGTGEIVGFTMACEINNAVESLGQWQRSGFYKVTGAQAYTAGRWHDLSMTQGSPRPNVYPGGLATATRLWYKSSGNIWHGANVSPKTKHLKSLMAFSATSTAVPSTLLLCDYIMFYPLIDLDDDSVQDMDNTSQALPRYTTGAGVMMFLVTTADAGGVSANIVVNYTNSSGTAGRTTPITVATTASSIPAHLTCSGVVANNYGPFLPLADGDNGVRSVQSVQLSTGMGGGWATLVLCKPLATFPLQTVSVPTERDYAIMLPSLPRVYDEAFLNFLYFPGGATAAGAIIQGFAEFIWN